MKNSCPICSSKKVKIISKEKNIAFTNLSSELKKFILSYCNNCTFIFQSSAYTKSYDKKIKKVYENYFVNHTFLFPRTDKTIIDSVDFLLPHIKENALLLEIGSARGDFLYLLKKRIPSINILGIEPTQDKVYIPTINSSFSDDLFVNKFDMIVMRHTLEHIKYPKEFVEKLKKISHKDTLIYIEVPNIELNLKNLTEDFEPDHVSYFSLYTLSRVFNNFKIISSSTENFLRVIFSNAGTNKEKNKPKTIMNPKKNIETLYKNKKKFFQYMQNENKSIVFYGVSHYFYFLAYQLSKHISLKNSYFYDDNYKENFEKRFKLKRISSLQNTIVILCSNVPSVQNKMLESLKGIDCHIIKPWSKV